ncbi:MAG: hypothetical protein NTV70_00325 [Acidobacteria bacterium]|nr:hypothetical protein [Acidobacteriota bacterium]
MFVDALDQWLAGVPHDLHIIPEVGIQTSALVEVFVSALDEHGYASSEYKIESEAIPGLRVEVGSPSVLFTGCLEEITSFGTSDYGHDLSQTLRIYPGPPYSPEQRREIQLLISRLSLSTRAIFRFWSVNFEPASFEEISPLRNLRQSLESSLFDEDRICLALANDIAADDPGSNKFVNAFRLLETVTRRVLEERIRAVRFDSSLDQRSFLDIVRVLQSDLKTRLREALKWKQKEYTPILMKACRVFEPGRAYNPDEALDQLVKFRNQSVHGPAGSGEAILFPWEMRPLGKLTEVVLELAGFLIQEEASTGACERT